MPSSLIALIPSLLSRKYGKFAKLLCVDREFRDNEELRLIMVFADYLDIAELSVLHNWFASYVYDHSWSHVINKT